MSRPGEQPVHIMHLGLGDWADGTAGFTLEQEGFYLRLVRRLYAVGGRLKDDDAHNAKRLAVDIRAYRRLKRFLIAEGKIEITGDQLVQHRVLRDLEDIKTRRESAAEHGRKGAEARKSKAFQAAGSGQLPSDFGPTSPGSPAEVADKECKKPSDFSIATMASPPPPPPPKKEPPTLKGTASITADVSEAFDAYNATAGRLGLAKAEKLTADRARKIAARLGDYGLDGWRKALGMIERSPFLMGKTHHGFRAGLDFVCQPSSFSKLHDGGYSTSNGTPALRLIDFGDGEQHVPRYGGGRS